jgi:fumarate hydratase class II
LVPVVLRIAALFGIEPNKKRIREHLGNYLMLMTVLNPHIGYEKAAKISLTAYHEDLTIRPDEMTHLLRGTR